MGEVFLVAGRGAPAAGFLHLEGNRPVELEAAPAVQ